MRAGVEWARATGRKLRRSAPTGPGEPGAPEQSPASGRPRTYGVATVSLLPTAVRVRAAVVLGVPLVIGLVVVTRPWASAPASRVRTGGPAPTPGLTAPATASPTASASSGGPTPSASASPTPNPTTTAQLRALNHLLDLDQPARRAVAAAVYDAGECGYDDGLDQDTAALRSAAANRQRLAVTVLATPVSAVPGGARLTAALARALKDSATADRAYATWVSTAAQADDCDPDSVRGGAAYAAAARVSAQASASKRAFLNLWSPLASTAGLPARTAETI